MALHVHVGVPAPEDAIRLLNGLRHRIPVLLALSANSPFWQARDSGFASARTLIFQAFPRAGLPRFFADYAYYTEAVDALIVPGAIPDPSFLWWDVRLQPALGTVEVRVMDAQSRVARRHSTGRADPITRAPRARGRAPTDDARPGGARREPLPSRARRDGRPTDRPDRSASDPGARDTRLAACQMSPALARARVCRRLDRVQQLAAATGADRQRAFVARNERLDGLVASLADHFLAPDWRAQVAREDPRHMSDPTERSGICAAGSHTPVPHPHERRCFTGEPTRWSTRACTRGSAPSRPTVTGSASAGTAPPTPRASSTAPNRPGMTSNLRELAGHISSPLFFTHIRAAIGSAVQQTNCHPFRHDNWLFMHNGYINEFAAIKRDLVLAVDPSLYPEIQGQADTEVLFYLALTLRSRGRPAGRGRAGDRARRGGRRPPRGAPPVPGHDRDHRRREHLGVPLLQRA